MGNRPKTAAARLEQMRNNSQKILQTPDLQPREYNKAARQNIRARRRTAALQERSVASIRKSMAGPTVKENE